VDHPWKNYAAGTVRAVRQRLEGLPATLGGLIDLKGTGFGLDTLSDLRPYDMVVIDLERIMADSRDPEIAEHAIKIITAYVLNLLIEAMTRGTAQVDNIIVFADELNRLAPSRGNGGIGAQLAQIARTTRDRGIVLFGAGQFRSGINEDILKAASVHYSMQTPDYELNDRIYSTLSPEFKARLTQLRPGETLLQYPSLRTAVFARFPRPFLLTGGRRWRDQFPVAPPRPIHESVAERLAALDPERRPHIDDVRHLIEPVLAGDNDVDARREQIVEILRSIEMAHLTGRDPMRELPWEQFRKLVLEKLAPARRSTPESLFPPEPDEEE
jgi:hypothetical protein